MLQGYLQKEAKKKFGANLLKIILVRIVGWNSPYMKMESLVIVDQHATVNTFSGLVHTARQAMEAVSTRIEWANRKEAALHGRRSDWG